MLNEFYIDLISNASMDIFPDNAISKFVNRLPQTINLDGKWEVAVNEIFYPLSHKAQKRDINFKLGSSAVKEFDTKSRIFSYSENDDINTLKIKFNNALEDAYRTDFKNPDPFIPPKLTLDEIEEKNSKGEIKKKQKVSIHAGYVNSNNKERSVMIYMRDHVFIRALGFDIHTIKRDTSYLQTKSKTQITAAYVPDLGMKSHLMFIYTDLINEHFVGDTSARVLRVIPLDKTVSENLGHVSFNTPYYYPVRMNKLEDISILLCDETGNQIKFKSGRVYLSLHFRKAV